LFGQLGVVLRQFVISCGHSEKLRQCVALSFGACAQSASLLRVTPLRGVPCWFSGVLAEPQVCRAFEILERIGAVVSFAPSLTAVQVLCSSSLC